MQGKLTILFIFLFSTFLVAQTNISGTITSDSTLTAANSPYIVTGNLKVNSGVTLTVEDGVRLEFNEGIRLFVLGTLKATKAVFTSRADTLGGTPEPGYWGNIQIGDYYHYGQAHFSNCEIKYAGKNDYSNIYVYKGKVKLDTSYVSYSKWDGVKLMGNNIAEITGSTISNCNSLGIYITSGDKVVLTNSTIQTCNWPIRYDGTASVVFNGINDISGNTHDGILMHASSYGSMVWDSVDVPYVLEHDFSIVEGDSLIIAPGNVVKSMGGHLYVRGYLRAAAENSAEAIVFTSYRDDNAMGDTNGDGFTSAPKANDWYGIYFMETSDTMSILENCNISFAGRGYSGAVTTDNASPTINKCTFSNNYYGAKFIGLSKPWFSNNNIGSSQMVPVAMSFEAMPVFINNSFPESDNQYDAIGILGGNLRGNATLPQRDFTSISNVTYLLLGTVTVPVGMTLTINPGVVIKGYYYSHHIIVKGKLVANGTATDPIIFTSAKDDKYGNPKDTNKDGTSSVPKIGDWAGIVFESGSDNSSLINNCKINFARLPWNYYHLNGVYASTAALTLINSSPTIKNTLFKDVDYGIRIFAQSNPQVDSCKFWNTTYTPVLMSVSANPTFSGDSVLNAGITAIGIGGEYLPVDGTLRKRNFAGFENITYALMSDLHINSGTKVTIEPGVVIKMQNNTGIYVSGGLKADGTITAPVGTISENGTLSENAYEEIVFTSMKDDNAGNPRDTNGDGNGTSPAANNWKTIQYEETSDATFSKMNHCQIKFAGSGYKGGVTYKDASANIENSLVTDSYYGVVCEGASAPHVTWVSIENCQADPIAMSLKSNPSFSNITFTANGSKGIKILEGTLSSNATLKKRSLAGIDNIAYIINRLTISSNAMLTIEPGVVVKFNLHYSHGITVNGALVANGTPDEEIVFTSIRDDSNGGDTNNDGNNSAPAKGNWRGILFNSSSSEGLNALNNCSVRYAGNDYYSYHNEIAAIRIYNSTVKVDSCIIEQSSSSGIGIFGNSTPTITNSEINNISRTPIVMSMFANPTFANNTSSNVGIMAIGIKGENYSVDATVPIRNFGGFNNITYYLYETSTVNSGTVITIPAGVVFKNGKLEVKGTLKILGEVGKEVVFTDLKDDEYGNPKDTNGDGSLSAPRIAGTRIKFYDVSNDASTIKNAVFRYSDIAVYLEQASPNLQDILFENDNWGIYLTGVSAPVLTGSIFNDLKYAPIRTSLVSYPSVVAGNLILGTTYKAIGVLENETLVQDVTLTKRNFAGIINIPYLFGNYTVASNAVLTIEPGVVLKFFANKGLRVRKGLIANGGSTSDSVIVFTDFRDDFYGGDTNSDSTKTSPWDWHRGWNGIVFEDEALDKECLLNYVTIQYAGHYYPNNHAAIYTNSSSPTILNSVFKNNYNVLITKGASNPTINYCDIYQNKGFGVNNVDKSFVIDAENNWWGDNSGPTHSGNPGGTGQPVSDGVDYTPWLGAGAINPIMGDVSLNGSVQAFDASLLLKHVSGVETLDPTQLSVADVSGDGSVVAYDASLILQYSVGLISTFPAEVGSDPAPEMPKMDKQTRDYLALQKVQNVSLAIGGVTVNRGEEFSIPVDISSTQGVTAVQIEMNINTDLYSVSDVTLSDDFSSYNVSYGFNEETQKLVIAIAGVKPMETEGELLTINFVANEEIKGVANSNLKVTKFLANETDLTGNVTSATIEFIGKPTTYGLNQNYPNPFNPSTVISYQIPEDNVNVKIAIYDINGQIVKTLVNETQNAGRYNVTWNATNNAGSKVSSGVYIYRIIANNFVATKKLMVLK